eukprot:7902273-Pyramimonas_sp.AAC.1
MLPSLTLSSAGSGLDEGGALVVRQVANKTERKTGPLQVQYAPEGAASRGVVADGLWPNVTVITPPALQRTVNM